MPANKLKTMIILILVVANLALAGLLITRSSSATRYQEDTLRKAVAALEDNGITISTTLPSAPIQLLPIRATRDEAAEQVFMESFLGAATSQNQGGPVEYRSTLGSGYLRQNGEFGITYTEGWQLPSDQTPAEAAQQLFTTAGISAQLISQTPGELVTLEYVQLLGQVTVLDHNLTLEFQNGQLRSVSGRYIPAARQELSFDSEPIDLAIVLTHFYAQVRDGGYLISELRGVRSSYRLTANIYTPVWNFDTDLGTYYLDPVTGELIY